MDLNINIKYKIKNNLEFLGENTIRVNNYKNFFYKRNNYNTFKNDGTFTIHKKEFSILRYTKHLMNSKKKWRNYHYKRRYILRKRYKKQYLRIKNYIQKNILTQDYIEHFKIKSFFHETCKQLIIEKNEKYNLDLFELLYLKKRFIINILKRN